MGSLDPALSDVGSSSQEPYPFFKMPVKALKD